MTCLWFGVRMKHSPVWDFIHFERFSSISIGTNVSSNALLEMKYKCLKSHWWLWEILSACFPSPIVTLFFLQKNICCSDQFGGLFFAKRVCVLVKGSQDYYNLLCLLETIKSVGMQRQSWSSTSFWRLQCHSTKTITIFFVFRRQSSLLACRENHGHLSLFEDFNVFRPRLL